MHKNKKWRFEYFAYNIYFYAESNRKLSHLFIHGKTATLIPDFAVEDLPLDRTVTLVPAMCGLPGGVSEEPVT